MARREASDHGRFGDLLRAGRLAADLTQEQLAERSGLSVHAIGMLERGVRRAPRAITMERLARALELDARRKDELLAAGRGGTDPASTTSASPLFVGRDDELRAIAAALRDADGGPRGRHDGAAPGGGDGS